MKKENGLTMIATMLSIIIILILGVITVYLLIGDTGLWMNAKQKGNVYEQEPANTIKEPNTIYQPKEFQPSNDLGNIIKNTGM